MGELPLKKEFQIEVKDNGVYTRSKYVLYPKFLFRISDFGFWVLIISCSYLGGWWDLNSMCEFCQIFGAEWVVNKNNDY